ncbi:MAG TPA: transketolase [Planctomycetota bacterium]|nr:transketolase [Planctomycetota bacterium]
MGRPDINALKKKAAEIRRDVLIATTTAGSGHPGGSMSTCDYATALYFYKLRHDPTNPRWDKRDYVFFSHGHINPLIYALLAHAGYVNREEYLTTLRKFRSKFQGHPSAHHCPGIEVCSGSLGQGFGVACGVAIAMKRQKKPNRVFVMMGDGEQQEGSIWEAAMCAAHYKLDNLVAMVDLNGLQIDGKTQDVLNIEPLADKYRAFNFHVIEIDGHDMQSCVNALDTAEMVKGKPTMVIAKTVMGKGVKWMENDEKWHGTPISKEKLGPSVEELGFDKSHANVEVYKGHATDKLTV